MARNQLVTAVQTRAAEFLNRRYINRSGALRASKVADDTQKTPSVSSNEALALVAVAALRSRTAALGRAQANDTTLAGSVASWDAEVVAANAAMDIALKVLKNLYPHIVLPAAVIAVIDANNAGTIAPGPSQLAATWADAIKSQY